MYFSFILAITLVVLSACGSNNDSKKPVDDQNNNVAENTTDNIDNLETNNQDNTDNKMIRMQIVIWMM